MYIGMPTAGLQNYILAFLYSALALKFIDLVHLIVVQCSIDIFLIDWEKPRNRVGRGQGATAGTSTAVESGKGQPKEIKGQVSVWRSTFIANEFCEMQVYRKINLKMQLVVVLLALETIGFIYSGTLVSTLCQVL